MRPKMKKPLADVSGVGGAEEALEAEQGDVAAEAMFQQVLS